MPSQITQSENQDSGHEKSSKQASPMLYTWLMEPRHVEVWSSERANFNPIGSAPGTRTRPRNYDTHLLSLLVEREFFVESDMNQRRTLYACFEALLVLALSKE
ncbi:hypothetical protein J7337_003575 [Fusarium musae]|uniref:Uncharacterized protein n=1 Tax=Fusarium musae TaxID=1042133 RepID=A0A9P8DKL8_9HYPO|nr:hypothetical protein J7337_003575 [Fusarium musae]KAG9503624.1 hypothetical protein J7337_003575 [Fusarium musae]